MKFGTTYAAWTNNWSGDYQYYAKKVAGLGFDILEISAGDLLTMTDAELDSLKALAKELGIKINSNIGPPKCFDVSSSDPEVRKAGIKFLVDIMHRMDRLDSRSIIGVMFSYWPHDFIDLDKEAQWSRGVESLKEVGKTASALGITMGLEVVNRFETLVLNTAEEGVKFCNEVNNPNVKLLLDTFHMNIEEDNIPDAIRLAGDKLSGLHVGEGNRKFPGQGSLPWADMGKALRYINFTGDVVMEPFMLQGGTVGNAIKVWRDLSGGASESEIDKMAETSLKFLKSNFLS